MKKLFITVAFVAAAMFAQAQFFVAGNLGVDMGSTKVESTKTDKSFGFHVNPGFGYMFSDNMGVGIDVTFGMNTETTPKIEDEPETKVKTTTIGFAPYFRYVFAEVDNFRFYADAKFSYSTSKPKTTFDGKTTDGNKTNNLGFGIYPGMQYNFTDNISMVAAINVLELGFNMQTTESKDIDEETGKEKTVKTKNNNFGFGVNEASPITIGFVYTF